MKVGSENREKLIKLVREIVEKGGNKKDVENNVFNEFGIILDRSSVKYWIEKAFPELWANELAETEAIMKKWRQEYEPPKEITEEVSFLEQMKFTSDDLLILPDQH